MCSGQQDFFLFHLKLGIQQSKSILATTIPTWLIYDYANVTMLEQSTVPLTFFTNLMTRELRKLKKLISRKEMSNKKTTTKFLHPRMESSGEI